MNCKIIGCNREITRAPFRQMCMYHLSEFYRIQRNQRCTFKDCDELLYAKGFCHGHYAQLKTGNPMVPINYWYDVEAPPCDYDGCPKKSAVKRGGLCIGHYQQKKHGRDLEPLTPYMENFTDLGRICKGCDEDKPLETGFYRRKNASGSYHWSTYCRVCMIQQQLERIERRKKKEAGLA